MPNCKKCGSGQATKCGTVGGKQRYRCKECGSKYSEVQSQNKQKLNKITAKECCEKFISDPILKEGMSNLLALFRELKMKPCWYHTDSYKCKYKGKNVIYINIEKDWVRLRVCTTGTSYTYDGKLDMYLQILTDDMKDEFLSRLKPCSNCAICAPGYDVKISGELIKNICGKNLVYRIDNPTPEQFRWIEKFIFMRRRIIENMDNFTLKSNI